ncbi:SDR family oxidoreductase [Arthrobacter castelli]|uniref:SDR family oxidoreductase n=1 Tax=Arthrobacter castelli TaxID=271431 RepID=UPI000429105E|nr:SDR family oxidoreductase [Arthrobacter castelli]
MAEDQYTFQDPVKRFPSISPPEDQDQPEPGLDEWLTPHTDRGQDSYRGTGRLKGRRALITGADSGIGAAVAISFAREGADVALSYLPAEEKDARDIVRIIEESGGNAVAVPGDISDASKAKDMVARAAEGLGGLDILVNNAGKQISCERLEDLSDDQFDQTMKTNIYAMFWITKSALPYMEAGSSIINSTSVQAYNPSPDKIDYATTKAAINTFSKGLAQQLAPRGIRVNSVAPGPFWTPLQVSEGQPKEKLPHFGKSTPLGRAGQPTELGPAYVFLASSESSYVAGETLNVNGGQPTP